MEPGDSIDLPSLVLRISSDRDGEPLFLGSGVLVTPDRVLTCKHVVMETDPFGKSTDQPITVLLAAASSREQVRVTKVVSDRELDLAVLELERKLDIVPPVFLWGLTKVLEPEFRSCPLTAYGYAQRNQGRALWQHEIKDLRLFYSQADETLAEAQFAGGIPAGCSGGPVLLPFNHRLLYFATVYLGGERSATSRIITADPVARFLDRAGVRDIGRIDAPRALSLAKTQGDLAEIPVEHPADPRRRPNPYRGLAPFRELDAPYFFGREQETSALLALVKEHSLITLTGASGSGKSSLVHAGLVPRIRATNGWSAAVCRPKSDPFGEISKSLSSLIYRDLDKLERRKGRNELARGLKTRSLDLVDAVEAWEEDNKDQRLLLIVDQFEELYSGGVPTAEALRFVDDLLSLVRGDLPCAVLLSFRADFLGQVLAHGSMANALDSGPKKILGPMDEKAMRAAIVEPARQLGVRVETGLPERIISDVGGEAGNLPLLEFGLAQLWDKQTEGTITHAAYNAGGGVQGALARHADGVVDGLRSEEARVRQVLVQLVQPGEGTDDTGTAATREQIGEPNWPLVNKLADSRLVTIDRSEDGEETVEIVHEALIRHWPQLRLWVEQERGFRTWQEGLRRSLKDWERQHRDEGALLRGARLVEAEERLRTNGEAIDDAERGYVEASLRLRAREKRTGRRVRATLLASLAAGLITAIALSIWANFERTRAQEAQAEAEQQRNTALARQLAAQAELLLETARSDPATAALLAVESLRRQRTLEGYLIWSKAMRVLPRKTILLRHDDEVTDLNFSPDSKRLATASQNGTLTIWDLATGKILVSLKHPDAVTAVAFSPDGALVVSACNDGVARIWDVETAQEIHSFRHTTKVLSMSFSRDRHWLATASTDGTIYVWDLESGAVRSSLMHDRAVQRVAFAANGEYIAYTDRAGASRIWSIDTGHPIGVRLPTGPVQSMSLSGDARILATTTGSDEAIVWDVKSGNQLRRFAHGGSVLLATLSPDEKLLATAGTDGTARLWEISTGRQTARLEHDFWVTDVTFSMDGKGVATASGDGTARVWDVETGRELLRLAHEKPPRAVVFSPDGGSVATISQDQTVRVWAATTDVTVAALRHPAPVNAIAFSADGARLATASLGGTPIIWDTRTAQQVAKLPRQAGISTVALDPDGSRIAVGHLDGSTRVWNTNDGTEIARFSAKSKISALAFDPGGDRLAIASAGTVGIWDLSKETQVIKLPHPHVIWSLAFDPKGRLFATAGSDKVAIVWNSETGSEVTRLKHDDYVWGLAFTPDGSRLATSSQDGTTRIWDLATARPVIRIFNDGLVNDIAISADGRTLVTDGLDRIVRVWDTGTGNELARFMRRGEAGWVAFDTDGSKIISASFDTDMDLWRSASSLTEQGTTAFAGEESATTSNTATSAGTSRGHELWLQSVPWKVEDLVTRACSVIARNLTKREWQTYLGIVPYRPTCDGGIASAE